MSHTASVANRPLRGLRAAAGGAALFLALSVPGLAGESIITATPAGGNDIGAATLPPQAGWYAAAAFVPAVGSKAYDTYGHKISGIDGTFDSYTGAVALEYVYPVEIFGGRVASMVQLSYGSAKVKYEPAFTDDDIGLEDAYIDVFNWSKNLGQPSWAGGDSKADIGAWKYFPLGLNVSVGFAMKVPTGHYDKDSYTNVGSNLWIMSPNVGFTYLTQPSGPDDGPWEVSARIYYSFPLENSKTNYTTGQVFDIDWAIGKYITPQLEVALAGTYQQQTSSDTPPDDYASTFVNGNRYGSASYGPVVSYAVPDVGVFKVKVLVPQFYTANTIRGTMAVFSFARAL